MLSFISKKNMEIKNLNIKKKEKNNKNMTLFLFFRHF